LLSEGKLQESLLAQATAEHGEDPVAFRERRILEARKELQGQLPKVDEPKTIREWPAIAKSLRDKHGRWCLPAIMDCLNPEGIDDPASAMQLLRYWGADAMPPLLALLRERNERYVYVVCEVLMVLGRGRPEVARELTRLYNDEARSQKLREYAKDILLELGVRVEK
jgi:hypothetical protein